MKMTFDLESPVLLTERKNQTHIRIDSNVLRRKKRKRTLWVWFANQKTDPIRWEDELKCVNIVWRCNDEEKKMRLRGILILWNDFLANNKTQKIILYFVSFLLIKVWFCHLFLFHFNRLNFAFTLNNRIHEYLNRFTFNTFAFFSFSLFVNV